MTPPAAPVLASGAGDTVTTATTFFYRNVTFSRLFVVFSAVALFLLVVATQVAFRAYLASLRRKGENCSRVLVIGADEFADQAVRAFLQSMVIPCSVAGFVRLPGQTPSPACSPRLELEELESTVVEARLDDVIIAVPLTLLAEISSNIRKLERLSVPVRAILDLAPEFRSEIPYSIPATPRYWI